MRIFSVTAFLFLAATVTPLLANDVIEVESIESPGLPWAKLPSKDVFLNKDVYMGTTFHLVRPGHTPANHIVPNSNQIRFRKAIGLSGTKSFAIVHDLNPPDNSYIKEVFSRLDVSDEAHPVFSTSRVLGPTNDGPLYSSRPGHVTGLFEIPTARQLLLVYVSSFPHDKPVFRLEWTTFDGKPIAQFPLQWMANGEPFPSYLSDGYEYKWIHGRFDDATIAADGTISLRYNYGGVARLLLVRKGVVISDRKLTPNYFFDFAPVEIRISSGRVFASLDASGDTLRIRYDGETGLPSFVTLPSPREKRGQSWLQSLGDGETLIHLSTEGGRSTVLTWLRETEVLRQLTIEGDACAFDRTDSFARYLLSDGQTMVFGTSKELTTTLHWVRNGEEIGRKQLPFLVGKPAILSDGATVAVHELRGGQKMHFFRLAGQR